MKPCEVGFDGSIQVWVGRWTPTIKFARSMHKDKGPDIWESSSNPNLNGKITNTFIWWGKDDPELFYRNKEGKLFRINFEPVT
jgi:hypothetical protein